MKPLPPVSEWAQEYVEDEPEIDWELTLWRQAGALFQIICGTVLGFAAMTLPVLFIPAFYLIIRGIRQSTGLVPRPEKSMDESQIGSR